MEPSDERWLPTVKLRAVDTRLLGGGTSSLRGRHRKSRAGEEERNRVIQSVRFHVELHRTELMVEFSRLVALLDLLQFPHS